MLSPRARSIQTDVVFASDREAPLEPQHRQTVSQAYCSAISCGYSNGGLSEWAPMATIVQDGTYEASKPHIIPAPPTPSLQNGPTSCFEMWFAIRYKHLWRQGSQPNHVSNPD